MSAMSVASSIGGGTSTLPDHHDVGEPVTDASPTEPTINRPLPELTPWTEWFWTSGADGTLRIQGCSDCGDARAPAGADLPGVPQPFVGADRGVGPRHGRRLHGQRAPVAAELPAAVRDRGRRARGGPVGPPHDQHRRLRARARCTSASRSRCASSSTTTCGSRSSSRPADPTRRTRSPNPGLPAPRAARDRRSLRAPRRAVGRRSAGDRPAADGRPAVAHGRRLPRRRSPTPASRSTTSTACRPIPGAAGMGMSEGGVTAVEEALRLHPTWHNGGGDLPGPGGSVIAAMLAVASGLCRHVLCFRTVWESTYATLGLAAGAGGGRALGVDAVAGAVRRDVGVELDRHERQPVPPPLRRHPRDARSDRAQRARQRGAQPGRDLPRPDDDGRLPVGAADHVAVRAVRLRRAVRRVDRGDRVGRVGGRRPAEAGDPGRGGRHADPRARVVGPGHDHPRAAGARPVGAPLDPDQPPTRRRRPRARSTTASPSTRSRGSRRSASAASARPRTGSTAGAGSRSTATCRSTPTAASSRRAAPTASGSSTRRSPSCATTPATGRSPTPPPRSSPRAAARRRACCSSGATDHEAEQRKNEALPF